MTNKSVIQIYTSICANRIARITLTFVDLSLTLKSDETRSTFAKETFELIDTRGTILARIRGTIVDCMLTLFASVSWLASTSIVIDLIETLSVVTTWFTRTFVDVDFTSSTGPSWMTDTFMAEQFVDTYAIKARISRTKINLLMTTFSGKSRWTITTKVSHKIGAIGTK